VLKKLALFLPFALLCAACGNDSSTDPSGGQLQSQDLVIGTGGVVASGDIATVHYVGRLQNGNVFDSSRSRNQPFPFRVGAGQVIQGWDRGVPGMRIGGTRRLIIPPSLAYGSQGSPPAIPPNATLTFDIELLGVTR
jgi:FKBP-type peptidyl-prolyl cis-trans isomerase FkpA